MRRLIRRAVRYGKQIGINNVFTFKIAQAVIDIYRNDYPELKEHKDFIEEQLVREEEKFEKALKEDRPEIEKLIKDSLLWLKEETSADIAAIPVQKYKVNRDLKEIYRDFGKKSFNIYQKGGTHLELILEECEKHGYFSDFFKNEVTKSFNEELKKHQEFRVLRQPELLNPAWPTIRKWRQNTTPRPICFWRLCGKFWANKLFKKVPISLARECGLIFLIRKK